jgi:hypothetical protein
MKATMEIMTSRVRARLSKSLTTGVLAPAGALLDIARPNFRHFLSEPFNGQRGRRAMVDDLLARLGCEVVVETGTFRGATTNYFSRAHSGPVVSVEAAARFLIAARVRLRGRRNIRLIHGDARKGLRELSRDPKVAGRPTFFYLDAHWGDDLPLAEELRIIAAAWPSWVAVVDDFSVPDDPGYAYDSFGPDKTLDRAYLERAKIPALQCFWPKLRSADEDGMTRGCVVLTTNADMAAKLRASEHLRTIS